MKSSASREFRLPSKMLSGLLTVLTVLFAGSGLTDLAAAEPVGFKPIFNGKDLTGWNGDQNFWKVVDGTIVAESTPDKPCKENTFLRWTAGEVDDFVLKLEFRISGSEQANSGIQFRSQVEPDGHVVGYQADIDRAGKWLGACYDEKGRGVLAGRGESSVLTETRTTETFADRDELMSKINLDGWNEYVITARGNEIQLAINGQPTARVVDNNEAERDFSGLLALQLHSGPPMKIEFRNIQLQRLPLTGKKKVVFIAGSKSHGYFSHEHNAGCLLLADSLNQSGLPVQTAVYLNGWPQDVTAFDNADTVVCYCDGGGRHILNPHLKEFDQVMSRGVGLVCLHYAVETVIGPEGDHFLKWMGGFFEPNWSVNPHWTANFDNFPKHPITQGVKPFSINDEWYYHMRFPKQMEGVTPILTDMPPRETLNRPDGPHSGNPHVRESVLVRKEPQHVAWAYERDNEGRGFGFTGGHFHVNWQHDDFRKVVLNAIAWTAHLEVPSTGVQSPTPSVEQLKSNQDEPEPENFQFKPPVTGSTGKSTPATKTAPAVSASGTETKPLFSSPVVTSATPGHAVAIDVPIAGAKQLFLVVSDGGNGFACDWADWVEPSLIGPDGAQKLTERKWKSATSQWGGVRINANANGEPLRVADQEVPFGIGTHANSVIVYDLPEGHKFTRFQARGGLDAGGTRQADGKSTSVQFHVLTAAPGPRFQAILQGDAAGGSQSRELVDAIAQLTVAEGLEAQIFAGEPVLLNPTNIDIDARGRVWVCEVVNYRQFRNNDSAERTEGDRILILEDTNHDGQADSVKTFYQGRDIDSAHGICVLGNRALVSAGDSIFWLIDENGDDTSDRKEVLFTGIGGTQHDHGIHACVFGPDGKLYFNFGNAGGQIKDKNGQPITDKQGNVVDSSRKPYQEGMVFRCNLDGSEFETLGWNFRNNWEVCVDSFGTLWQSDNDDDGNRGVRINYVMEFGNYGYRDELTGAGWREPRTGWHSEIPLRHWHQNDPGSIPNLLQTGAGSPTGILVYEGSLLPERFRNQMIHCDAGPNIVRAYPVQTAGAGYTASIENILEGSRDQWFRPSDVCVAPDGSLFVADWYDPGVGGHRMADVERGRIFRLAPQSGNYRCPKIDVNTVAGAIEALCSPNLSARYLGWTALQQFGAAAEAELVKLLEQDNLRWQARALWALGKLDLPRDRKLTYLKAALGHPQPDLRITAIRLVRQLADEIPVAEYEDAISLDDESTAVRRELLIGLRDLDLPETPVYWTELAQQYDGKDRWYLEAIGIAAHHHWDDCLSHWLTRVGDQWNTPTGRDIIWRSRGKQTPELLARIIRDPQTPSEELPRYFRAFDFNRPVPAGLLAELAFDRDLLDRPEGRLIASESLARLEGFDWNANPQYARALSELVTAVAGTPDYVQLIGRFGLSEHFPSLVTLAIEHNSQQLGVDAVRVLLAQKQWSLISASLAQENTQSAISFVNVLGMSEENGATGPLHQAINNRDLEIAVRRAAVAALGRTPAGTKKLIEQAQLKGKFDAALEPVVAATLHNSSVKEAKELAGKLYPLPPAKDSAPLPSAAELAQRKGSWENGRLVFHTHGTCAKCHQVNGLGKDVGPDLSEIGKKLSRQALIESILYPSAGISHNYEAYTLVTAQGNVLTGLLVSQSDEEVAIKNAEGIVKSVPREEIEELVKQDVSLMPADLQKLMSASELVDVVEYMLTLKVKK